MLSLSLQVERDKAALFHVLLSVPVRVITRMQKTAQAGRDRQNKQIEAMCTTGLAEEEEEDGRVSGWWGAWVSGKHMKTGISLSDL